MTPEEQHRKNTLADLAKKAMPGPVDQPAYPHIEVNAQLLKALKNLTKYVRRSCLLHDVPSNQIDIIVEEAEIAIKNATQP